MDALDLRIAPPRGPRERLAGIVFSARVVDKLRASLPSGDLNGYFPFAGFSELWAYYTGIDLQQLQAVVRDAASEQAVEAWIAERTAQVDAEKINAKMERFPASRTPEHLRALFEQTYPEDLRANPGIPIFDLLERDDARLYAVVPRGT
jgi:hypothetical protein